jgi:hypothetical protein
LNWLICKLSIGFSVGAGIIFVRFVKYLYVLCVYQKANGMLYQSTLAQGEASN